MSKKKTQKDTPKDLVDATRQAIDDATTFNKREINTNFDYDSDAYTEVKQNLSRLIASGDLREAMALSLNLMKQGSRQAEMSDEGLMIDEIEDCLDVVLQELKKDDLPANEVIDWCTRMMANDCVGEIAKEPLQALRKRRNTASERVHAKFASERDACMKRLPAAVEQFVKAQKTIAISELQEANAKTPTSPYGSHWYRAVTAMLRSGRVAAKHDGVPNRTDVNRICKEANFNQYFFERITKLLLGVKVVKAQGSHGYVEGGNFEAFWKHDPEEVTKIMRAAVLNMIDESTSPRIWRSTSAKHASLIEFMTLFFIAFKGRAIPADQVGMVMQQFCLLPDSDLRKMAVGAGFQERQISPRDWKNWLDENGQPILLSAIYLADWAYQGEKQKVDWIYPSPMGLGCLGLGPIPEVPRLATELKADSNLAIYAGAGVELATLASLFRCCKIQRIDQLIEFQVDPKRLKEMPAAVTELRAIFAKLERVPASLKTALQTESPIGGRLGVRFCSALIKPATDEALTAIRQHPQLKGYLEPGAPHGFLLIKPGSNPENFVQRCRSLGFQIESL